MQISDVITSPWAIIPEKLLEIRSIYSSHVRGEKIDIAAIEARLARPLSNEHQDFEVSDGVAIIPISGVMGKRMNMLSQISGGSSTQLIARDINAAIDDPAVKSILLHIDSPGGTVDGTQTLANIVKEAADIKPVVAFADGMMASAAYWVGSAASEIVASSDTAQIGSIGVVTTHTDVSEAEAKDGIKTTEISAGRYKRIASQHAPLSAEGAEILQAHVDQLYTIFVDAVAENRGVSVDTVLEDMADGRVFLSKQAQRRGMIDHIADLETTILNMSTGVWPMTKKTQPQPAPAEDVATTELTIEQVAEQYPDIAIHFMNEGAEKERERIKACENAMLPGHEKLVESMKYDGKSQAADVALAIVGAEKKIRANHLQDFTANAPDPLPLAPVQPLDSLSIESTNLSLEDSAKAEWDNKKEIRDEFKTFGAFLGFKKVEQATARH